MTVNSGRLGVWLLVILSVAAAHTELLAENPSLSGLYPKDDLKSILVSRDQWHPFPPASKRAAWKALPTNARDTLVERGEKHLNQDVPQLPATLYLEYRRVGNRSNYQDVWLERRRMLHGLALAECVEGEGRFLDQLANVIWAICEESSWTWPAHISRQEAGVGLPDTLEPIVALFSAETASSLAWTEYLLRNKLDTVSPQICRRIRREVDQRILTPYLERDDFSWMAFGALRGGRRPNNWNPWVNSNVLTASLLLENDEERRLELVYKVLRCVDNFLVPYPADGSCDEGPSYWGRAGASLFDNLELLHSATDSRLDLYENDVIKEIGRFICRTHIASDYFVNVGDCDARINIPRDLVSRYGRRIRDPHLQELATSGLDQATLLDMEQGIQSLGRTLHLLFNPQNLLTADPSSPPSLRDAWLGDRDMQMMVARDTAGTTDGLYVAAWGGHNGQSHNHNDVGNFVVYLNGRPFVIDVGRPTYTRQTFSGDRYKIWAMQSAYHNLPTINGRMQEAGGKYVARDVRYQANNTTAQLEMDIAPSYPPEAGVKNWVRTVGLVRGKSAQVSDVFQLNESTADITLNLITPCQVSRLQAGQLRLADSQTPSSLLIEYEPSELAVEVETIELDDGKLQAMWGPRLHRILLRASSPQTRATWNLRFSPL